ncbi:NADH:flavin oxidoreductase [Anaerocolumna xylanovorans]|uniref:2,4-dienoyl-CoA reductase n=1 Tax=Anaerocolumna xylanovorans DSM 12503 TaxID=1121345 RepID=A0A1M7YIM8_9FIRM|nr:NADH:flavin oxidoreductase [Anaerocolumna xylanovorans]SHO52456.1 2,4-dienoyl-CoA reductase [Anaerocolumna xylanovorans DSM 12503]
MKVFSEIKLENMTIKNRIVRSATHSMLGNLDGTISEAELEMFEELAANEVGMIIAGQFFVSKRGIAAPGSNELSEDFHIDGVNRILPGIRPYGTKVIAQINHAGAKSYSEDKISASAIEFEPGKKAREMTIAEIESLKNDFISAAFRAKQAGLDGVQIHCAHDYLLCQFLTPSFNKRTDKYGGSSEGRFLIVEEIICGIKNKCGTGFPVFVKINTSAAEENELYVNDLKKMMPKFKLLGVEAVEFSGSNYKYMKYSDHNYFVEAAMEIKGETDIPVIVVGGIRGFNDMEAALDAGVDMVSMCRPLISEPDLITKLNSGQLKSRCTSCNKCFIAGKKRCILN